MLTSLALLALPALALASPHVGASPRQHRSFSTRVLRARGGDPADISKGSLTTAEGCTKFRHVAVGEFCIQVAADEGISLDEFYAMNPQIDSTCMNLWANSDYCVARTTSSPVSSPASTKAPAAALEPSTTSVPVTTKSLTPVKAAVVTTSTSFTSTPAPTPTPSASAADDENDDDEECDAEDEEEEETSTVPVASPTVQAAAVPKTTEAAAPTTTTSSSAAAVETTASSSSARASFFSNLGITGFLGENLTGIGSWFHSNLATDSTNGNSWCGFPYSDSSPGFAPSVGTMLKNFGGDYEKAATAYCGLEAIVTAPDGTTATGVILDGFDDTWVRTPNSIDLMYDFFTKLNGGKSTSDKNVVIKDITWTLTGTRNEQYKFKGAGSRGN